MTMNDYFTCPICGESVNLTHRSPELRDLTAPPPFYGKFHMGRNGRFKGRTKIKCEQLDEQGDLTAAHVLVEYPNKKYGNHLWRKGRFGALVLEPMKTLSDVLEEYEEQLVESRGSKRLTKAQSEDINDLLFG